MKILYVKCNSERAKEFQLKTIIYEIDGEKFVKKQALCQEAIPHLKKMKENYIKFSNIILDSKIKLVKIIDETDDSLVFEFIEGESLESRYTHSDNKKEILKNYEKLITTGFKTTTFNSHFMINKDTIKYFGNIDYSVFDGELCFDGISNIDLIFSNLIYTKENIYIIDYEWVFEVCLPISYIKSRSYVQKGISDPNSIDFSLIENNFLMNSVIGKKGFYKYQTNYLKKYFDISQPLNLKEDNKYFFQLFNEIEGCFTENNSQKQALVESENLKQYIFDFSGDIKIKKLRFDPLNDYLVLKINLLETDTEKVFIASTNAFYSNDDTYYFDTQDPQIYLHAENETYIKKVVFHLEYIAIGDLARDKISEIYLEILEKKSQEIELLQEDVNVKSQEIQKLHENLHGDIEHRDNVIAIHKGDIQHRDNIIHDMTIKNRIKKFFLLNKLKKVYSIFKVIVNNPKLLKKGWFHIKQGNLHYLLQKSLEKTQSIVTATATQTSNIDISTLFGSFEPENYSLNQEMIYIVIPIYNGYDYLEPLFSSIKRNTKSPYTLVVIDDASPDERIDIYLKKKLQEFSNVTFLSNEMNLGFVQSVNRAVSVCENHFVILNTDTEVPEHWLERLMKPIIDNNRVSTTTPFTNSGTIASFPNFLEDNSIFMNLSVDKLDSYFATIQTKGFYEEIPTGVGFCMGVNYTLVKKIGFFDAETFGKGYGEENDWCQRAIKAGYINVMVPNLFIYHKHGGSFLSEDKKRYIETNLVKLAKKHPNYSKDIDFFIEKNPYKLLRELLIIIISSNQGEGIYLIFDHALGGGANHYRDELVAKYKKADKKILEVIYNFYSDRYELLYFHQDTKIIIELLNFEDLKVFLFKLGILEIFINELVSFKRIDEMLIVIQELKKVKKAKLIIPIHDFFSICPSYTLLNDKGSFCNIPDLDTCQKCMSNNHLEWKDFFQDEINIESWKINWNKILYDADEILCFSNSSKNIVMKAYPQLKRERITVIPHTIEAIQKIEIKQTENITIGILGAINYAKGASVVADLVKLIDKENLNIQVVVIGEISHSIKSDKFFVTGRYDKKDLPKIIQKHSINIFLIPSIWPETFSYTTQEIISMDLPLMVFDLGAPAERVREYEKGLVLNSLNVDEIIESIKFLKGCKK